MTVVLTRKTCANAAAVDWLASRPSSMWWLILSLAHKHNLNLNFTCCMPALSITRMCKIWRSWHAYMHDAYIWLQVICVPVSVVGLSAESTLFKGIRNQDQLVGKFYLQT
jgi:hypothetical protein